MLRSEKRRKKIRRGVAILRERFSKLIRLRINMRRKMIAIREIKIMLVIRVKMVVI